MPVTAGGTTESFDNKTLLTPVNLADLLVWATLIVTTGTPRDYEVRTLKSPFISLNLGIYRKSLEKAATRTEPRGPIEEPTTLDYRERA